LPTRRVVESCQKTLDDAGVAAAQVDLFVPIRPTCASSRRSPPSSFQRRAVFFNLDRFGNTSCASIPLCLHDAMAQGPLKKGDRLLIVGFRRGAHLGSCLTRWSM